MAQMKRFVLTAVLAGFGLGAAPASALPAVPVIEPGPVAVPAQFFRFSIDSEDDGYIHDRHYDWNQYRDATSRKERIRDYYRMQKEAEKDY